MTKSTQANNGNNYRYVFARDEPLFPVGRTVATPGALTLLDHAGVNASVLLARHQRGDFGDIDEADCVANVNAPEVATVRPTGNSGTSRANV